MNAEIFEELYEKINSAYVSKDIINVSVEDDSIGCYEYGGGCFNDSNSEYVILTVRLEFSNKLVTKKDLQNFITNADTYASLHDLLEDYIENNNIEYDQNDIEVNSDDSFVYMDINAQVYNDLECFV